MRTFPDLTGKHFARSKVSTFSRMLEGARARTWSAAQVQIFQGSYARFHATGGQALWDDRSFPMTGTRLGSQG